MGVIGKTISQKLLAILSGGVASTIDIVWVMSAPKVVSYKRLNSLRNNPGKSIGKQVVDDWKCNHDEYKRYHALLKKLQKQGLIEPISVGKNKVWSVTAIGSSFLRPRERKISDAGEFVVPGHATIISYDIPERLRRERDRIRETLKMIGFKQAHQSLWFGNKKVTKSFLELLRERKIFDYVHIFEINKSGTLEKVSN